MKIVDPAKITHYNASVEDLERYLVFWILAAGKNGTIAAKNLAKLEQILGQQYLSTSIFEKIRLYTITLGVDEFAKLLHSCGIGCYNKKAVYLLKAASSRLDLRRCTVEDLEKLPGIGRKSSRCFVIHTRKDAWYAGLDTHALKFLKEKGIPAPKSTPSNRKQYEALEKVFLSFVPEGMTAGEFDLSNWNRFKVGGNERCEGRVHSSVRISNGQKKVVV